MAELPTCLANEVDPRDIPFSPFVNRSIRPTTFVRPSSPDSEKDAPLYESAPNVTDLEAHPRGPPKLSRWEYLTAHIPLFDQTNETWADKDHKDEESNGYSPERDFQMGRPTMSRKDSIFAEGGRETLDPDDPRVTGITPNRIDDEKRLKEQVRLQLRKGEPRKSSIIKQNINSKLSRQKFILRLARALLTFQAPSHRIEPQLKAVARAFELDASFTPMPNMIMVTFEDDSTDESKTEFVKATGKLDLGKLTQIHKVYKAVVHDEIGAEEGSRGLRDILIAEPIYGRWNRSFFAVVCCGLICVMSFQGSLLDAGASACLGFSLSILQLFLSAKNKILATIFEMMVAITAGFASQALTAIDNGHYFCSSAVSSSGVVLILPGALILSASLDLGARNTLSGAVKMVYVLLYVLLLTYCITLGSNVYMWTDTAQRIMQAEAQASLSTVVRMGSFIVDAGFNSSLPWAMGTVAFIPDHAVLTAAENHFISAGCYRAPGLPSYLQPFPLYARLLLVPIYAITASSRNLQPWNKNLTVMVVIACVGYGVNFFAARVLGTLGPNNSFTNMAGALAIGLIGNGYSRLYGGTAFTAMATGVAFLVPSGIAGMGGLGTEGSADNSIAITFRIVKVAISITVGLFLGGFFVYSWEGLIPKCWRRKPRKEKLALFAF